MKHARLLSLFLLFFLGAVGSKVFAARLYTPSSVRDISANRAYCIGSTASAINFRYYVCNTGTGTPVSTTLTISWYANSVNDTTSGTLVSTSTVACPRTTGGTASYTPPITVTDTTYYYCVISWDGTGTCNTSGSITSSATRIIVSESAGTITGADFICMGTPQTYINSVPGGTWSRSNTRLTIDTNSGVANGVSAGTVRITYRMGCGSYATKLVTVSVVPTVNAITGGATPLCVGRTTRLNCSPSGGVWSSSNTTVASIGTNRIVTALSPGTTTISYTRSNLCGTYVATKVVTVTAVPSAIVGPDVVCIGSPTTFSDSVAGGTWRSSNTRLTIDTFSGNAAGVTNGAVRIYYRMACGLSVSKVVTVSSTPTVNAITGGTANICTGATTTLYCSPSGGVWSSGTTSVATIGTNRVVTGISPGTSTITYTRTNACGTVSANKVVTVTAAPSAITADSTTCEGYTIPFTNTLPYGVWTTSNGAVATIGSATGMLTGVAAGTVRITYNTGCTPYVTKMLTVDATPAAITGASLLCGPGATTTLSSATAGGGWSSADPAIATVDGGTGVVTAVSYGTTTITYNIGTPCSATLTVTVGNTPASITGAANMCAGTTTTLSNTVNFGTWSSSDTTIATVDGSGIVTGVAQGAATITYNTGCGTPATHAMSVYTQPGSITGTASVCQAATTTLANAVTGGTWSSDNASVATVNTTTGVVTGVTDGTVHITYSNGGCYSTQEVTVNPLADHGTITGGSSLCVAGVLDLESDGATGGAWTSGNTAVATVDATGLVTGVATGTSTISYSVTNGCGTTSATQVVSVNSAPSSGTISGTLNVCQSATTTLTSSVTGGVWSSDNTVAATVNSSGVVTGVAGGNANISYTVTTGCGTAVTSAHVTVNPLPSAGTISGTMVVCATSTTSLTSTEAGGAWTSSNNAIATVDASGIVTGVTTGTVNISYTVSNSCGTAVATAEVTVGVTPASITGASSLCLGGSSSLTIADASGTWTSSNPAQASVNPTTGVVSSVSVGTSTISYTSATGCFSSALTVTVSSTVPGIAGTPKACVGYTSTLSNPTAGGVWSSSNTSIATVDATTGVVTGVAPGSVTISYTIAGGCYSPVTFFVYANPEPITGVGTICTESYTVLYSTIGGSGQWISSNTTVATANLTSGMVNGLASGTSTISYYVPASGCYVTTVVTVNQSPAAVSGPSAICKDATATYTNAVAGGTWSSFQPSVLPIDASTGAASGLTAGNSIITYSLANGCFRTLATTVNPLPEAITATSNNICLGITSTFTSPTSGGTWSSSNTSVATINATSGVATSTGLGSTTISYTSSAGCSAIAGLTIYSGLAAITGDSVVCKGYSTTLANTTSGGTWSTSLSSVASINSVTGVLMGMNGGTVRITYKLPGGCIALRAFTVAAITGSSSLCAGTTSTLSHIVAGGTWSSSNPGAAAINVSTGVVTAVAVGTSVITYRISPTVFNTIPVSVYNLPAPITGSGTICEGSSSLYTGTIGGSATWSSSNTSVATINTTSGFAAGVAQGTVTLTYRVPTTGCYTTRTVSVIPTPAVICGPSTLCVGDVQTFTSATTDGLWASSPTTVATVGSTTGIVTAVTAGGMNISYTLSNGCRRVRAVTVNGLPANISGPSSVASGSSITLSCSTSGGVWSSANTSIAAPGTMMTITGSVSTTGIVTGYSAGSTTISYTGMNGCSRSKVVSVVAAKPGETVSGVAEVAAFNLYPNPTSGSFTIETDVRGSLVVFAYDGKVVSEYQLTEKMTTVSLPSELPAGMYICNFRFDDGTSKTAKLYLQK
jgi:trimeric autotransporter adhesin